jgi:aspartate kinase
VEKGVVPVIAGFVGRTADGRITTLGRGGSDTTAFILARALKADEVILVTDADGIMSADPKIIANPQKLPEIDVGTLVALADSGAKFIHTKALKYKDSCTNVRVISHTHGDLRENGTLITGALESELDVNIANNSPALSITVVGKGICDAPLIMQKLAEETRVHSSLIGLSVNHNSMILYAVQEGDPELLLEKIHDIVIKHKETIAMSVKLSLAFLKIHGVGLEKTPGIIGKVSDTLRTHGINIFGILTITSSILLFVDWNLKEIALNVVKESLRGGEK